MSALMPHKPVMVSNQVRRYSIGLGVLALLLFIAGVYQQPAIGFDSRFVMFAQEMLRHGPSFFPTTYGEPYADYSATTTFLIYLLSLPFGHVSLLSAWLPTAIASALLVVLMYRLLAPYSPRWALLSIATLLLSVTFISETRAVSLDQMIATVAFAVFYLGYAADHFGAPARRHWILALLLLGFAIRGPIGLVLPTGMLCSYYLLRGEWRRTLVFGLQASLVLLVSIGLLLALAYLSGGEHFVQDVVRMQVTGRIDGREGSSGVFYYFSSSLGNYALAYPLALLTALAVLLNGRQLRDREWALLKYCAAAGLIVMIGLSIPQAKKARYVLPMLPMAAIVAAYPFQVLGGRIFAGLRGLIQGVWLLLPGLLIGGLLMAHHRFPEQLPSINAILAVLGVLQLIALGWLFQPQWRTLGLAFTAVFAVWVSYWVVIEPVERSLFDTRAFSTAVHERLKQEPAPLILHGMGKDAKAIKFMVNIDEDLRPLFSGSLEELRALHGPAWLVMAKTDYQTLQGTEFGALPVVLQQRFDKNDYVLLRLPAAQR